MTQAELEAAGQLRLLELPKLTKARPQLKGLEHPIWTENKAKLVERYLFYFVQITHHGSYIDGFAGPQRLTTPENWCAKRVIESEPKWLRHFFLCELKLEPFGALEKLRDEQQPIGKGKAARSIDLFQGDFNAKVQDVLKSPLLTEKEATFCLLDQRTFQCHWDTIKTLAQHKKAGNKVELFYFLATGWFERALVAIKNHEILDRWWGRSDWQSLRGINGTERALIFCDRFQSELGYKYTAPFPILGRQHGGRTMYRMIHASDHDQAPVLMARAYNRAIYPKETQEQLDLFISKETGIS